MALSDSALCTATSIIKITGILNGRPLIYASKDENLPLLLNNFEISVYIFSSHLDLVKKLMITSAQITIYGKS